jgi:hypothetical protein
MKIKILPILVAVSLLLTGINVIATDTDDNNTVKIVEEDHHISFSEATIETKGDYLSVNIAEANTVLRATGKPMLPVYTKTFTFPRGTKIKNVECIISDITSEVIDGKIEPSPRPIPRISLKNSIDQNGDEEETIKNNNNGGETIEDKSIYSSSDLFPDSWYDYKIGCGLYEGKDVIFVKVDCYPTRYSPAENTLYYVDTIDIRVKYEEASTTVTSDSEYQLLIITPTRFRLWLTPLYLHKIIMGVSTKIETLESIYQNPEYNGRDKPEQIKKFIKYAKEEWNITYLLLVGGLKSKIYAEDKDNCNEGSKAWHLPVRYANIHMWVGKNQEHGYISDLYYADIYKYNESSGEDDEFDDWDSNGNDIFADEDGDLLDLYPDVYYGRLACRNLFEVRTMVKKIIRYERPTILSKIIGKPWMEKMIAVGGNSFGFYPDLGESGEWDGEYLCNLSLDYMNDIITKPVKILATHNNTGGPRPIPRDIAWEFSKGAGFVLFQGHGAPWIWDTNWADYSYTWCGGLPIYYFSALINGGKLPIVVVGGCHNACFNVTLLQTMRDTEGKYYWTYGLPASECFSWRLCAKRGGGAIASTGCTGAGLGYASNPLSLSAELESNFFYEIGRNNATTLGLAHSGSIVKYIIDNPGCENNIDEVYCITEYQLFGDPSLKIGGY